MKNANDQGEVVVVVVGVDVIVGTPSRMVFNVMFKDSQFTGQFQVQKMRVFSHTSHRRET